MYVSIVTRTRSFFIKGFLVSENQLRGYKAAAHNPNVSGEAQEKARTILREAGEPESNRRPGRAGDNVSSAEDLESRGNVGNVIGGYKATMNNPRVSQEAKQRAEGVLREHDAI
ncbi:hypothetical protein Clacol_003792 [Clathrus columnatus]|uniref:Conidiation-specific protein 6 n=1 Tax=Clathrus columnatus TaxID=1419009 RepID=A0AAV5A4L5_9AGAM|nr:hypothetical protein Clacol_003792 [Clathrus columnatus]